jgi:hypothetical protein
MTKDHSLRVVLVTDELGRQAYKKAPLGKCCVVLHGSLEDVQRVAALLGKRVLIVEDQRNGGEE